MTTPSVRYVFATTLKSFEVRLLIANSEFKDRRFIQDQVVLGIYILYRFQHLVVFCNGNFYEVKVSDSYGSPITLLDLEKQLEWIKHDAHHSDCEFP